MTTPAVNIDNILTAVSQYGYREVKPHEAADFTYADISHVVGRNTDIRPISRNSDKIGGFRLCAPWDHLGGTISIIPSTVEYTAEYDSNNIAVKRFRGGSFWTSGVIPTFPDKPSNNFINMVEAKALERLKGQDVHIGNFFAEAHKVVEMFTHNASTIARQVENFKKSKPLWQAVTTWERGNLPRHLWCKIPDRWLELQYGWNPLISDLTGAVMHIIKRSRFEQPFVTASARAHTTVMTKSNPLGLEDSVVAETIWKNLWKAHVGFTYRLRNPLLAELSSLGLINPAEIVWETTRYSFVVDWFVPISQWLSNLTAAAGMDFVTGSWSYSTEKTPGTSSIVSQSSAVQGGIPPPTFRGKMKIFGRRCYADTPVPALYVKSPISLVHAANAMALLKQAFR